MYYPSVADLHVHVVAVLLNSNLLFIIGTGLELDKDIQFINIDASAISDPPNVTDLLKMNHTQVAVIFLKCDKTYVLIL